MKETLLVVWQNIETRQKYHVGTLTFKPHENIYEFQYNYGSHHRGLEQAIESGFNGIHEFEMNENVLQSEELFYFFNKRLPNTKRSDYALLLKRFGLDESSSKMEFLKRTKGRLATDNYELFSPVILEEKEFTLETYIEAWQYYDGDVVIDQLEVEEALVLIREPNNEYDKFAVKIHTEKGYMLGYISAVYSEFIANIIDNQRKYKVRISQKYPDAIPQMKIWIEIKGEYTFQNVCKKDYENRTRELIFC